jgi:hypothetical protein
MASAPSDTTIALPFHHYWLKLHLPGKARDRRLLDQHRGAACGRFISGATDGQTRPNKSPTYHFDAGLCGGTCAATPGARRPAHQGEVVDVQLRSADGFIRSVTLKTGRESQASCSRLFGVRPADRQH